MQQELSAKSVKDGMPRVSFVITGFSSFPGVESNPTEKLVEWIKSSFLSSNPDIAAPVSIQSATVLTVAARAVDKWMDDFFGSLPKLAADEILILVHLGVNAEGRVLQLESRAFNDASFGIPDLDGWKPHQQPIDPMQPLTCCLTCNLDLPACCDSLQAQDCPLLISQDAGRYLCNWIYYRSLQHTLNRPNMHSLFVHTPPFACVPREQQQGVLMAVLQALEQEVQIQEKLGSGTETVEPSRVEVEMEAVAA